jgi:hypothetical protein
MIVIGIYESRAAHSHKRLEELSRWVELGWLGFLLWPIFNTTEKKFL